MDELRHTVERICFLRGLAEARITLCPRRRFRTGISRGNGPRGTGFPPVEAATGGMRVCGAAC